MINVRDEIEEIVLSFQSNGDIVSFTDNLDGTYTINTSDLGNLQSGFKIVLTYADSSLNRDVVISSITSSSFTFSGTNITEPTGWQMAVYFEVGHRIELNKKYENKAKAINKRVQEYPLFWLYTDFERTPSDLEHVAFDTVLQGAIVDFSDKDYYEEQRIDENFKPVLYPYLELFNAALNTLPYKGKFNTPYGSGKEIDIITTDRPFFGSADQTANVLPQVTDAVEWQVNLAWNKNDEVCTSY